MNLTIKEALETIAIQLNLNSNNQTAFIDSNKKYQQ